MKFDSTPDVESEELLNLTSMIDVVFTLLAFFVITVRVFAVERDAVVSAERAPHAAGLVKGDLPQQVTIRLLNDPATSHMRIMIGSNQFNEPGAITKQLREINLPSVPVVFAASPDLTVEQVTSAVDAALHSPMAKVSLRRTGPGEGS
jgi:biopolymer transport protein ExbD